MSSDTKTLQDKGNKVQEIKIRRSTKLLYFPFFSPVAQLLLL